MYNEGIVKDKEMKERHIEIRVEKVEDQPILPIVGLFDNLIQGNFEVIQKSMTRGETTLFLDYTVKDLL